MNGSNMRSRRRAFSLVGIVLLISAVAGGCSSSVATPTAPAATPVVAATPVAATSVAATPAAVAATPVPGSSMVPSDVAGTVAFMVPDNTDSHWLNQDAVSYKTWMHNLAPNVNVLVLNATGDPQNQLSQAQAALTQGAKVLVVAAVDGTQAGKIAQATTAANANVIAYTRQITGGPVKYMVGADPHEIGVALGNWMISKTKNGDTIAIIAGSTDDSFAHLEHDGYMSVLKPLFDSGARKMVGDVWTPGWDTVKAHAEMDAILTAAHNNVQGVLTSNDSTAQGAIGALQTVGLAGKVPVTGVDASLASDQLILKGLQTMSAWRSFDTQAQYSAELTVDLLTSQTPASSYFSGTYNDGSKDVPTKAVPSIVIDISNMQMLIDVKSIDKTALCQGISAGTGPC